MTIKSANPNTLRTILAGAQPGDTIMLEPGLYEGSYGTPTAGNPERPITVAGNQFLPGPPYAAADPLTVTRDAGQGVTIPVEDAGFWSAWFGRPDLPPESISVGDAHALVVAVDYAARTVTIDRPLAWLAGAPVGYRSDATAGVVRFWGDAPIPKPEPGPEEPDVESVTLTGPPASVALLRAMIGAFGDLSITD